MRAATFTAEGAPFWPNEEALDAEPDEELRPLADAYTAFRDGRSLDFLSSSPRATRGNASGA
jgi:hypothetical protein